MNKNMGNMDKNLRLVAGIIILVVGYLNESWWGLIGLVSILTSVVSFCPAYFPFNISTIKAKKE
jgi:Inner membrane protein YgaP-like, transmembrane domain